MKLRKRMKKIKKLQDTFELPWEVYRLYGRPEIWGDQVRFGEDNDYGTLEEHQAAIKVLAKEFGVKELAAAQPKEQFYVKYDRGDGSMPQILELSEDKTWPELVIDFMRFLTREDGPFYPMAETSFDEVQKAMDKDRRDRINKAVLEGDKE